MAGWVAIVAGMTFPEHHAAFEALLDDLRAVSGQPVAVVSHVRPDGDCLGAATALTRLLRSLGIAATAYNQHPAPPRLRPFCEGTPWEFEALTVGDAAAAIYVDSAGMDRVGQLLGPNLPPAWGNFDHHVTNPGFARHNLIAPDATATCELIAGLAQDLAWPVDAATANALYLGLFTDTGGFRYANLSARTFELAGWLVRQGANPLGVAAAVLEGRPWGGLDLLERFLASRRRYADGLLATAQLTLGDFTETNTTREDAENLGGLLRDAEGVAIAAAFEELPDGRWKCSLRATDPARRVDQLALRYGGGGHPCAAGFTLPHSLAEDLPGFIETATQHLAAHP